MFACCCGEPPQMIYFDPCPNWEYNGFKYRTHAITFEGFKRAFCQQEPDGPEVDCSDVPFDCPDNPNFTIQELFAVIEDKVFYVNGDCKPYCGVPRLGPVPPASRQCTVGRTSTNCPQDTCVQGSGPVDNIIGVFPVPDSPTPISLGAVGCEDGVSCPQIGNFGCGRLRLLTDVDDADNPFQTGDCCDQRCPCESEDAGPFDPVPCFTENKCDYPFDGDCPDGSEPEYGTRCLEPLIEGEDGCDPHKGCPCWGDASSLQATVQMIAIDLGGSTSGYYLYYDENSCPQIEPYTVQQASFNATMRPVKTVNRVKTCGGGIPGVTCPTTTSSDARVIQYEIEATESIIEQPIFYNKGIGQIPRSVEYGPGCFGPQTNFEANARTYFAYKALEVGCGGVVGFGGFGAAFFTGWPAWATAQGDLPPAQSPDSPQGICEEDFTPVRVANPNAIGGLMANTCGVQVNDLDWSESGLDTDDCGTFGFNFLSTFCGSVFNPEFEDTPPCNGLTGAYGSSPDPSRGTAQVYYWKPTSEACQLAPECSFVKAVCDASPNVSRVEDGQFGARFIFILRMTAPAITDLCKSRIPPDCT